MPIKVIQNATAGIYELQTKQISFLRIEASVDGGVIITPLEQVVTSAQNLPGLGNELHSLSKKFDG